MTEFHTRAAARRHLRTVGNQPPPCPPELRDPDAATRTADLARPYLHCHAPTGTHCIVPGTTRPPTAAPTTHAAAPPPNQLGTTHARHRSAHRMGVRAWPDPNRLDHQARPDRTGGLHTVQRFRAENPDTFPAYVLELTDEALARAIVARILDCGWTPPTLDQPSEEHDSA